VKIFFHLAYFLYSLLFLDTTKAPIQMQVEVMLWCLLYGAFLYLALLLWSS